MKKVEWKFLDPYRQQLHTALDITSLVTLGLATYGAFFGDIWLASTQWLLVSIWMLILSSHVRRL
ncbi:MAG: hypothetical protein Q8L46_00595 [candidate division WWE3 bacterium]|nr:hypothetical protein [candidate division WWE3 bacterium]